MAKAFILDKSAMFSLEELNRWKHDTIEGLKTFVMSNIDHFPPADEFNYFGREEVIVTLVVLLISYVILAMPCFVGRSSKQRQQAHITGARKSRLHTSSSDGKFNTSKKIDESSEQPQSLIERFYFHAQRSGISAMMDSFYDDTDFELETDHDRFVRAWESHIRFSQYRRLVLPPTCKMYRPSQSTYHTLFDRREIERNLHLLVDESTWKKILSYFRNLYDILDKILSKLLNKQSTEKFSVHMMNMFRYRIRKQRGMPVEDDFTDDGDDGSVSTLGSSSISEKRSALSATAQNVMTPVVTNKKEAVAKDVPPLLNPLPATAATTSRSLIPPSLIDDETVQEGGDKPPQDKTHVTFLAPLVADDSKHAINGGKSTQLLPPPFPFNEHRDENDRLQVQDIIDDVIKEIEGGDELGSLLNDSVTSADVPDGRSSPRPRFHTASFLDINDELSFVTSTEQKHDMTPSPTKNTSPHQIMKKDISLGLGDVHEPLTPSSVPMLQPIAVSDTQSGRVSPMPSPKLMKRNNSFDNAANMMFFDTANSNRQLADMSRDVPIPDSGGYILGDEFLGSSCTPLLVFVNSRSGSQQGDLLITQFRRLLNPIQIWDLANGGPEKVLKSFSVLSRFQVLICGGDGTVSWIISALEKMELKRWPPIGILPLGTGNDLARVHGWGGGYNNESLLVILKQISEAYISMLDLWELDITTVNKKGKIKKEVKAFLNYLGVGVDAQAALQVHNLRERKPTLFFSRFFNKAYYALAGGEEAIKNSCTNLSEQITLVADGIEIPLPPNSQGIIFLNIDSYTGGVPMWSKGLRPRRRKARSMSEGEILKGNKSFPRNDSIEDLADYEVPKELSFEEKVAKLTACDKQSSCQDGLLDVVSIRGAFHLGQIRVGLGNADLLCQCREATILLKKNFAVQIDGEPWRQSQSTLRIRRKSDRATMLHRSVADNGGVETEVTKLLNWANEKEIIDRNQYAEIMGEFSRRAEFKKVKKQQEKTSW